MKMLGIVGGGQLGRMLVEAAQKLKISTIVLDPTPNSPAGQITDQIVGDFKNPVQIRKLAKHVSYLTFEIEGANAKVMQQLEGEGIKVSPRAQTLSTIQDKLLQKQFLLANNLPTGQFIAVKNEEDIKRAAEYLGYPLILKSRFHGYDGRGNAIIKSPADIKKAIAKLKGKKVYLEKFLQLKNEFAIQIARSNKGDIKVYPIVNTIQKNGICHIVKFPADIPESVDKLVVEIAQKTVSLLPGAGVFAIEFFQAQTGKILINEIAPRVHNSGHWTIEGAYASQFENHVRAVVNMPLASTKPKVKAAVMINILGKRNGKAKIRGINKVRKTDSTYVHFYGKFETRVERKMGHITVTGSNVNACLNKAIRVRRLIYI